MFYIAFLFLDFDVLFGARFGVKTHSLVFDFLLWSGLLLLVIFFFARLLSSRSFLAELILLLWIWLDI